MSLLWLNGEKRCSTCRKYKVPAEYNKHVTKKDGIQSQCRDCQHSEQRKYKSPEDRFWKTYHAKTVRVGKCIEWHTKKDYPMVRWQGGFIAVRRLVYQLAIGPLLDNEFVLSSCNNKHCVRHAHLVKGTKIDREYKRVTQTPMGDRHWSRLHPERVARGERSGVYTHPETRAYGERNGSRLHPERLARGKANGLAKLTESDIPVIFALATEGRTQIEIAKYFNVSPSAIWLVLHKKNWKHVLDEMIDSSVRQSAVQNQVE